MDELTLTTNIVTAVDGFRPIAREWDDLVDRSARRTYFRAGSPLCRCTPTP